MNKVRIQISAPEHSGKTSLIVLIGRYLESLGATVSVQRADPQLPEKLDHDDLLLSTRIKDLEITITEMQTFK